MRATRDFGRATFFHRRRFFGRGLLVAAGDFLFWLCFFLNRRMRISFLALFVQSVEDEHFLDPFSYSP